MLGLANHYHLLKESQKQDSQKDDNKQLPSVEKENDASSESGNKCLLQNQLKVKKNQVVQLQMG